MVLHRNPYTAGNPVGDKPSFVGRADILREAKRVLQDPNQNAITLYGQRRIGKTSILQYLTEYLPKEGNFHAVFFDLEDRAAKPLGQVVEELANTIARDLGLPEPNLGKKPEQAFRDIWLPEVLNDIQQKMMATGSAELSSKSSLVLLFDEFDVLADPQAGQAAKEFFPYLRSLLSLDRKRLRFIFTLGRNLGDLNQVALSLFKGVPDKRVSLLSRSDTESLIRLSENNTTLKWSRPAVTKIWTLTNGHPFLTQALCWEIWQNAYEVNPAIPPLIDVPEVEAAINSTLEKSRNALDWLWQGLGPAEKVVAAALAQAGTGPVTQEVIENILNESGIVIIIRELSEEAPKRLQEWDLIEPADGGYRFRVELLRIWIAEHFPLSLVQRELDAVQPAADGLYQAARSLYQAQNLESAKPLLVQAISYNPNHRGASELLSEIYIVGGEIEKAQSLLENLLSAYPSAARPRLIQVYLKQADTASDDDNKLLWYEKVLDISSNQPTARTAIRNIWVTRGEAALNAGNLKVALEAFEKSKDDKKIKEITAHIRNSEIQAGLKQVLLLESTQQLESAKLRTLELSALYPEAQGEWDIIIKRLNDKEHLSEIYQQALGAKAQSDHKKAIQLLLEIINLQPDYKDAAFLFYEEVTAESFQKTDLQAQLYDTKDLKSEKKASVKRSQSILRKELNIWNPLDYLRLLGWIMFKPDLRTEYLNSYNLDAIPTRKNTDITHARWIMSILTTFPVFYLQIGQLLGIVSTNPTLNFFPNTIFWSLAGTIIVYLWIGFSKLPNSEERDLFKIILLSIVAFLSITISVVNLNVWLLLITTLILTIAKGKSLVAGKPDNIIYIFLSIPSFVAVSFIGWYVSITAFGGGFIGAIVGVFAFILAGLMAALIVSGAAFFMSILVTGAPAKKALSNWGSALLLCSHGLLLWISFFGGMEIINDWLK